MIERERERERVESTQLKDELISIGTLEWLDCAVTTAIVSNQLTFTACQDICRHFRGIFSETNTLSG